MALSTGDKLGPYEILAPIGAGGMGEVWKARDTRLDRTVAIKVCHDQFSERFEREARAVAALNHSNICTLHDVGPNYLVMEFIDGPTLADRIKAGKIPLDEALALAGQIAEALEAAHEKGIIHRDLKPANIKLTGDGKVKVLDFGLAKAFASDQAPVDPTNSPTATMSSTRAGVILGTAGYMSPEQARGLAVDKRSDIWSFGCVVYELLSGAPAFPGDTVADLVAAVMTRDVELDKIPEHLRPAIAKCVRRDPRQRWRDIGDVRMALEEATPNHDRPAVKSRVSWMAGAGVLLAGLLLGMLLMKLLRPAIEPPMLQLQIAPPPGEAFSRRGDAAISPDGRMIAFVATSHEVPKLWIRRLDSTTARELAGTEAAESPFWSPDSRSLGFFAAGKLQRIDLGGGLPQALASIPQLRGAAWSPDGTIVFATSALGGLRRIAAVGGFAAELTKLDSASGEISHRWPQFLPDGKRFLFYLRGSKPNLSGIYASSLDRPREKTLVVESATAGRFCPALGPHPGYLLWVRGGGVVAQPFDPGSGELSGRPTQLPGAEDVPLNGIVNLADFSIASDGKLLLNTGGDRYQLAWFNREGKVVSTLLNQDPYFSVRLSPDGGRIAMTISDPSGNRDLWLLELGRGVKSRLTTGKVVVGIAWSPDGQRIVFANFGVPALYEKNSSGAGEERQLLRSQRSLFPGDFSPDGRYLVYEEETGVDDNSALSFLSAAGDGKPVTYLTTPSGKLNPSFSPDGKWTTYTSNESGVEQIFVQRVPADDARKWQVSTNGGNFARWRRDGRELFYRAPDGMLMAVAVHPNQQRLEFGTPARLFRTVTSPGLRLYGYDVAADGQRILALAPAKGTGGSTPLTLIMNWQAALKP